jgi:hypothetical protein
VSKWYQLVLLKAYSSSVKLSEPIIRIELPETCCWSLDWANSEVIAIGTTTGVVAVYNLAPSLKSLTDGSACLNDGEATIFIIFSRFCRDNKHSSHTLSLSTPICHPSCSMDSCSSRLTSWIARSRRKSDRDSYWWLRRFALPYRHSGWK